MAPGSDAQGADEAAGTTPPARTDESLVASLRGGDEAAFAEIVRTWSPLMLRVARAHVSTDASAEEVVQDAWIAVIRGLDGFAGRSSLRTWTLSILTNLAKTRGVSESRTLPWASLGPSDVDGGGPTVDPDRFRGPEEQWAGHWTSLGSPRPWEPTPTDSLLAAEIRDQLMIALEQLPKRQRVVVSLRDVHGLSSPEVCDVLGISAANQRVLLHRARARLRAQLESYYRGATHAVTR